MNLPFQENTRSLHGWLSRWIEMCSIELKESVMYSVCNCAYPIIKIWARTNAFFIVGWHKNRSTFFGYSPAYTHTPKYLLLIIAFIISNNFCVVSFSHHIHLQIGNLWVCLFSITAKCVGALWDDEMPWTQYIFQKTIKKAESIDSTRVDGDGVEVCRICIVFILMMISFLLKLCGTRWIRQPTERFSHNTRFVRLY